MEMMSEQIAELATALSKAQGEFGVAKEDAQNPHFKSSYATLESIHDVIREPLAKNGLSVVHLAVDGKMYTTLMHSSGQFLRCEFVLPQGTPQQLGSAISYFKRYGLCCILAIPTGEGEDDGNEAENAPTASTMPTVKKPESPQFLTLTQVKTIEDLLGEDVEMLNRILTIRKVKSLHEISSKDYQFIVQALKERQ